MMADTVFRSHVMHITIYSYLGPDKWGHREFLPGVHGIGHSCFTNWFSNMVKQVSQEILSEPENCWGGREHHPWPRLQDHGVPDPNSWPSKLSFFADCRKTCCYTHMHLCRIFVGYLLMLLRYADATTSASFSKCAAYRCTLFSKWIVCIGMHVLALYAEKSSQHLALPWLLRLCAHAGRMIWTFSI